MIKEVLRKVKEKAISDDNEHWLRMEQYIQRKDVTWNDVPFYQYFAMYIISGILMYIIIKTLHI